MDDLYLDDDVLTDENAQFEHEQDKAHFYKLLKVYGYDVNDIDYSTPINVEDPDSGLARLPKFMAKLKLADFDEIDKFNFVLSKISMEQDIKMTTICSYLVEDFVSADFLMKNILQKYNSFKIKSENDRKR